jgi:uncharacterized protein with GYD domain
MATYIILSRFSTETFKDPKDFKSVAEKVASEIRKRCPGVTWKQSFATMGRFDVVDFVEADDPREVERAAMIIRGYGHSFTETLPGTPWESFLKTMSQDAPEMAARR